MKMANQEDENITVSEIYETLKSGPFLKNLYWDVLSVIKEKNSFKQIKEITEKLIHKKTEVLANLSDDPADSLQRIKMVTEICSMTYAVDTVFSKIMFIKMQKEFKSHIINSIEDLRKEKKINDSVWSKLAQDPAIRSLSESSSGKNNVSQQKPVAETSSRPVRNKRLKMTPNEIAIKNYEIRSEIHKDLKAINSEEKKKEIYQKKLRPKNHVTSEKQIEAMPKSILKKKQNDAKQTPASPHLKGTEVKSKKKSCFENTEEVKITPESESDDEGSDSDSIISVGGVSTASVSSVHTSDLSSFDDEISLCSEDETEGAKRRISLKELKVMCNGKLPEKINSSILKDLSEVSKESSKKNTPVKSKEQTEEISKKKSSENDKSNKNQAEDNLKRKTSENNFKEQIEESSRRKTVGNNKHQVEKSPKRKTNENSNSPIQKSPEKKTTQTNQSQSEESSKEKTSENNKLQVENGPRRLPPAVNKRLTQSFQDLLDSADKAMELKSDKRIRKPNSKYSSDSILCTVPKIKERKKQTVVEDEKTASPIAQPNKKRTRKSSSDSGDEFVPPKNFKVLPFPENDTKSNLNSPNQSTPLETFKPQSPVRSLTSRRTAPVTLFST